MLRTVRHCLAQISNHVAHLLLYRLEFKDFTSHYSFVLLYLLCFASSLNCLDKVLKMMNAFPLHFQHKQPAHYSSFTLCDDLIITTELWKTLIYKKEKIKTC